uniref:Ovule protein n=1 Tax=Hymenolepis diminuta TaxID=6216 RepID=A0A0R3SIP9_HYMDI
LFCGRIDYVITSVSFHFVAIATYSVQEGVLPFFWVFAQVNSELRDKICRLMRKMWSQVVDIHFIFVFIKESFNKRRIEEVCHWFAHISTVIRFKHKINFACC